MLGAQLHDFFAQAIVGAARRRHVSVRITAQPRLYAGIEIHDIAPETKFDELDARHFDRQIEQKITFFNQRLEHDTVILARERLDGEPDAAMLGLLDAARVAGHDADALERHVDMAQKQRQRPLPDRTEAHYDQPALKLDVFLFVHFLFPGSADFCAVEFSILSAALSKNAVARAAPSYLQQYFAARIAAFEIAMRVAGFPEREHA